MDYMDRELHEECGVFGIIGHQDASTNKRPQQKQKACR